MKTHIVLFFAAFLLALSLDAQTLKIPQRPANAPTGSQFAQLIATNSLQEREQQIFFQVTNGNIPEFFRKFCEVNVTNVAVGKTNFAKLFVAPDYLAVGSDEDYFFTPMTPFTAQKIADAFDCTLPTRKMVNEIYFAAAVKLSPSPMPPSQAMVTVPAFQLHNKIVRQQRAATLEKFPLGALVGGDKKDIVISKLLVGAPGKVAIYGWHKTNRAAIQPLFLGHAATWADYSHGVRFVQNKLIVNGETKTVAEVLANPALAPVLSDEGIVTHPRYIFSEFPGSENSNTNKIVFNRFQRSSAFDEQTMWLAFDHGVRVLVNAPIAEKLALPRQMKLVFYALPNGNTIEQTVGKQTSTNDDWHFNIQHIGAQTRFLRDELTNENLVVVYLENSLKSWPAWRRTFGDNAVSEIVGKIMNRFEAFQPEIVLTSHSGGGAFVFGFLNSIKSIPNEISRIAFLDSDYNYETAQHRDKLGAWLQSNPQHSLIVLAYHDDIALLNGKTFVSAAGGTWGKSHLMKKDFEKVFPFSEKTSGDLQTFSALNGRLQFLFLENPERKILHTLQVEKNGFIHCIVAGTPLENKGYEYWGEPAYTNWISKE